LQNKDELVICFYDDKCGGKKETTKEDCNATLCCPIGGEYKIASVNDCYAEQNRLLKEAYTQALKENNLVAEEEYRKLVEQVNQQATSLDEQQRLIAETKQQLLQICRENVLSMYPESINGESPERRNARFQAMNSCFNKYGQ